jgi:hypothetical protein
MLFLSVNYILRNDNIICESKKGFLIEALIRFYWGEGLYNIKEAFHLREYNKKEGSEGIFAV